MTTPILPPPTIQISDEDLTASFAHALRQRSTAAREWERQSRQWEALYRAAIAERVQGLERAVDEIRGDLAFAREPLAEYAHEAWSGWMQYVFEKANGVCLNGTVIIPPWAVERWQRQINTPYADLPEDEKQSDRAEADKMLAVLRAALAERTGAAPGLAHARAAMGEETT
jgi:hypothetical protein